MSFALATTLPPPLRPGDEVALIASARKVTPEGIAPFCSAMEQAGFRVRLGENLFATHRLLAGTDVQRAADLQAALDAPEIRAIWCARGGYGSLRVLEALDWRGFRENPKWLIGFSDVTALLNACNLQGVAALHANMAAQYSAEALYHESFLQTLAALSGAPPALAAPSHVLNRVGRTFAPLIGGNLSLLQCLLGTPHDFSSDGKILFVEDVDEYPYRIDRMIFHLKRAGKLANLAGLLVGGFTEIKDDEPPFGASPYEIIAEATAEYDYPIAFDAPAGHFPLNFPLIIGGTYEMDVSTNGFALRPKTGV